MNEKRIYTTSELEGMSIYDLRLVLRSLGGVPKSKKGREMINEILDIQMGNKRAEKLSNRGRKPKIAHPDDSNRESNEASDKFPAFPGGGRPFTECDLGDRNYYTDGVSAPISVEVHDAGCEPEKIILASGILLFVNGEGYLCDMTDLSNPLYYFVEKGIIFSYDLKVGDNGRDNPFVMIWVSDL